jgi:glycosyltransferase involved in cell wall biosynthesis
MQADYIHVTGFVEDVDHYLRKCQLAVFPLTLGAGIKIKVLRSLALGIPVITSRVGAEGIDEIGEVIVLAETDEDFEYKIECLLNDYNQVQGLSKKSQVYISENFGWEKSENILKDIYK